MKTSMNMTIAKSGTLAAALLSGVLVFGVQAASAQTNAAPATTATRPAKTPPDQNSLPNSGPPATTTQTTGEAPRDPTIKKMNQDEKAKVEREGK
jgi:hypothetical protein